MNKLYKLWNNVNHLKGVVGARTDNDDFDPLMIDFTKNNSTTWITNGSEEKRDEIIKNILSSMIYNSHQGQFEVALIDFENKKNKKSSLSEFIGANENYRSTLTYSFVNNVYQKINNLKNEKAARMEYFSIKGYKTINDFNRSEERTMPYIILILTNIQHFQIKENKFKHSIKSLVNDTTPDVGIRTIVSIDDYKVILHNADLINDLKEDITITLEKDNYFTAKYHKTSDSRGRLS